MPKKYLCECGEYLGKQEFDNHNGKYGEGKVPMKHQRIMRIKELERLVEIYERYVDFDDVIKKDRQREKSECLRKLKEKCEKEIKEKYEKEIEKIEEKYRKEEIEFEKVVKSIGSKRRMENEDIEDISEGICAKRRKKNCIIIEE